MKIALDYDDTFTRDPELWRGFVVSALSHNHVVKFVTNRTMQHDNKGLEGEAVGLGIGIVYCGVDAKSECYDADIWIDDSPLTIPSVVAMKMCTLGM